MPIPLGLLLALLVLLAHEAIHDGLPGDFQSWRLALLLPLVALPALLARQTEAWLHGQRMRGRLPLRTLAARCRLHDLSLPVVAYGLVVAAQLGVAAEWLAPRSHLLEGLVLLGPLLIAELGLRISEQGLAERVARDPELATPPIGLARLPMALFVASPVPIFQATLDLLALDRDLEVFFGLTMAGSVLSVLGLLLLLGTMLPWLFRALMPVQPRFPAHVAEPILDAARALAFSPRRLLALATGHRMVNALMLGLFPWSRYLVLTDGLLAVLDPAALRGVVAHEVAHARAAHQLWMLTLMSSVLAALAHVVLLHEFEALPVWLLLAGMAVVGLVLVAVFRRLAHRFEFEADQLGAEAIGDPEACVRALRRVGQLGGGDVNRNSFMHPSEARRVASLQRNAADPARRVAFHRTGRRVRMAILGVAAVAAVVVVHAQWRVLPFDRVVQAFYTGDFATAADRLERLPAGIVVGQEEMVEQLEEEIVVAREIAPEPAPWSTLQPRLAAGARARATPVLLVDGAAAARPWFSLLAWTAERPSLQEMLLYRLVRLLADPDATAAERAPYVERLLDLELPPELRAWVEQQA